MSIDSDLGDGEHHGSPLRDGTVKGIPRSHNPEDVDDDGCCFISSLTPIVPNVDDVNEDPDSDAPKPNTPTKSVADSYRFVRDEWLARTEIGRRFTTWYYSGGSRKMLDFVEGFPVLRRPARGTLIAGSYVIDVLRQYFHTPRVTELKYSHL